MAESSGKYLLTLFALLFLAIGGSAAKAGEAGLGGLAGTLIDGETGEALIGATVLIEGTTIGAASDLDGYYSIGKIPVGEYNVLIRSIGYNQVKIEHLMIRDGEITKIDMALTSEAIKGQDIVVTARAAQDNEASMLKSRQKSVVISDAISAESISRSGSGDAADAMKQVTGASVVGGRYVYVRGLGERYSKAQLNGAVLPSSDPDKNSFQMDLIPSNLLENIVVIKSFTPDRPGSFTGGIIDIGTRTYPEKFTLKISTSGAGSRETSDNPDYLTYQGGDRDWLGMDDGTREIPDLLSDTNVNIPSWASCYTNPDSAYLLDKLTKAFNNQASPKKKRPGLNRNLSISVGNKVELFGQPLGYLASFSYKRGFTFYDNGIIAQYKQTGNIDDTDALAREFQFSDAKGSDEVLWGGLGTLSYKPGNSHEFSLNYVYTQDGESTARYLNGHFYDSNLDSTKFYEQRVLKYVERSLRSYQMQGQHHFAGLAGLQAHWLMSFTNNSHDEPDVRFFSDHYTIGDDGDTTYQITPNLYLVPQRFYRTLDESNDIYDLKFELPFRQWVGLQSKLKFGGMYSDKSREYRERVFVFNNQNFAQIDEFGGNPEAFLDSGNMGIIDSTGSHYQFGNYLEESSEARSNYNGTEKISAIFAMVEMPLKRNLNLIGGARFETTRTEVATQDTVNYDPAKLNADDLLPSFSLIYNVYYDMNIRLAYGKTLARPTMREMAPFVSYDIANAFYFIGNPSLKRTLTDNVDLRWEWFTRPGEIYALSLFYKNFKNPIERAIKNDNGEIQFQNVKTAYVYGLELEFRKKLDQLWHKLANYQVGGNFALTTSEVKVPDAEMAFIRALNPHASDHRPLWGQSEFLVNFSAGYENQRRGMTVDLSFNYFSERLSEVSLGGTPNIFEQGRASLNFSIGQIIYHAFKLKLGARNLLEPDVKKVHHFKGHDFIHQKYKTHRSFSIGVSYQIG